MDTINLEICLYIFGQATYFLKGVYFINLPILKTSTRLCIIRFWVCASYKYSFKSHTYYNNILLISFQIV